jgi:hypothetical protein
MDLCPDGSELEVFIGSEFSDDSAEEGEQPDISEEDEAEDNENEDRSGKDAFHAGLDRIYGLLNIDKTVLTYQDIS